MNVLMYCYIQNFMIGLKAKNHPSKSHRDSIYAVGFVCCPCVTLIALGFLEQFNLMTLLEEAWPLSYNTTSSKDFSSPAGVICIVVGVGTIFVVRKLLLNQKDELKKKLRLVEWKKINVLAGDNFPILFFLVGIILGFLTLISFYVGFSLTLVIWLIVNEYLRRRLS